MLLNLNRVSEGEIVIYTHTRKIVCLFVFVISINSVDTKKNMLSLQ